MKERSSCFDIVIPNCKTCFIVFSIMLGSFILQAQPNISSFSPKSGVAGTAVTINGANFSSTPSSNIVYFGAVKATVTSASTASLVVQVPVGATYQPITVTVNNLTAFSDQPFVVIQANTGTIDANSFFGKVDFTTGSSPLAISAADFDGDGKIDLVVANSGTNKVSVFRNSGSPGTISFESKVDFSFGSGGPFGAATGDIDGDGKLDFAITAFNDNSVVVFRNTSTAGQINGGSFSNSSYSTGSGPTGIAIQDMDGDGKSELIIANASANTVSVLRNTSTSGNPSFAASVEYAAGTTPQGIAIRDMDSDGKPEITVANFNSSVISVLKNVSSTGTLNASSFNTNTDYTISGGSRCAAIGDLDNDGKPDIIASTTSNNVSLLRNVSAGTIISNSFSAKVDITASTGPNGIALTDLNGDGKLDFVVVHSNSTVSVYGNTIIASGIFSPTTSFALPVNLSAGTTSNSVVIADLDGDGLSDIAVTNSGSSSFSAFRSKIDVNPPYVSTNTTAPTIIPNSDVPVTVSLADEFGSIATAKIQYRPVAGASPNNFITADLIHGAGSNYSFTIPASNVSELGVEYKFLLIDNSGNSNAGSQQLYNVTINHTTGLEISSYASANGETQANYRIISIPLVLDNKSANDVFSNEIGDYDPTAWRMFRYNGSSYVELSGASVLVPGEGYWFIAISSSPLNTGSGTTVNVNTSAPFNITLQPGWNQIGNPYNFNISWADVIAANPGVASNLGNSSRVRAFRGVSSDENIIRVMEGGFVKNTSSSPITIKIPVTKNAGAQAGRQNIMDVALTNSLDESDWEVRFGLKAGNTEYNFGGLGMRQDANIDFDRYDDFNLPRFMEYLEIKYPKTRVGMTYTKDIVPTTENFVWEFKVETNLNENMVTLRWDNSYFGNGKSLFLLDIVSHRITDMSILDHYDFTNTGSRAFKVIFGNPEFVKTELIPDNIVLYDPYPNPFIDQVFVEYALPKTAHELGGEIEIYNSVGTRIGSSQLNHESGRGKWSWQSEGQLPGLYFVRLRIGDRSATKKIIKR